MSPQWICTQLIFLHPPVAAQLWERTDGQCWTGLGTPSSRLELLANSPSIAAATQIHNTRGRCGLFRICDIPTREVFVAVRTSEVGGNHLWYARYDVVDSCPATRNVEWHDASRMDPTGRSFAADGSDVAIVTGFDPQPDSFIISADGHLRRFSPSSPLASITGNPWSDIGAPVDAAGLSFAVSAGALVATIFPTSPPELRVFVGAHGPAPEYDPTFDDVFVARTVDGVTWDWTLVDVGTALGDLDFGTSTPFRNSISASQRRRTLFGVSFVEQVIFTGDSFGSGLYSCVLPPLPSPAAGAYRVVHHDQCLGPPLYGIPTMPHPSDMGSAFGGPGLVPRGRDVLGPSIVGTIFDDPGWGCDNGCGCPPGPCPRSPDAVHAFTTGDIACTGYVYEVDSASAAGTSGLGRPATWHNLLAPTAPALFPPGLAPPNGVPCSATMPCPTLATCLPSGFCSGVGGGEFSGDEFFGNVALSDNAGNVMVSRDDGNTWVLAANAPGGSDGNVSIDGAGSIWYSVAFGGLPAFLSRIPASALSQPGVPSFDTSCVGLGCNANGYFMIPGSVPPSVAPSCDLSTPCPGGQTCFRGVCTGAACDGTVICPIAQTCVGGSCVGVSCTGNAPCPLGACVGGVCSATSCSSNADCPSGQTCYASSCLISTTAEGDRPWMIARHDTSNFVLVTWRGGATPNSVSGGEITYCSGTTPCDSLGSSWCGPFALPAGCGMACPITQTGGGGLWVALSNPVPPGDPNYPTNWGPSGGCPGVDGYDVVGISEIENWRQLGTGCSAPILSLPECIYYVSEPPSGQTQDPLGNAVPAGLARPFQMASWSLRFAGSGDSDDVALAISDWVDVATGNPCNQPPPGNCAAMPLQPYCTCRPEVRLLRHDAATGIWGGPGGRAARAPIMSLAGFSANSDAGALPLRPTSHVLPALAFFDSAQLGVYWMDFRTGGLIPPNTTQCPPSATMPFGCEYLFQYRSRQTRFVGSTLTSTSESAWTVVPPGIAFPLQYAGLSGSPCAPMDGYYGDVDLTATARLHAHSAHMLFNVPSPAMPPPLGCYTNRAVMGLVWAPRTPPQ